MRDLRHALKERVLVLDGAMGTLLQERGLAPGASPEEMNLTAPETVEQIHREYREAGADIIVSNTFGGSRPKLEHYALQDRLYEINARGVELARRAAGTRGFVAASMGPTGRFVEPVGDATFDEMVAIFAEQALPLVEAGADAITLETFLDIREAKAALLGVRQVSPTIPVIAMLTFDDNGRSVLGTSPEAAAVTLEGAGADILGSNCGLGPEGICDLLGAMRRVSTLPLISQANAGLPLMLEGKTVFPAQPEEMTSCLNRLLALGVRIVGGCCGTTPAHIRAIAAELRRRSTPFVPPLEAGVTRLSSRTGVVVIGGGEPVALAGERINPTGKKAFAAELREGKISYIRREALEQVAAGATLLDVNVGAPGVDEPACMERAVFCVNGAVPVPLVLDSSNPEALERGLKAVDGKALVNSVNGEEKSLARVLPLVKRYGAAVVGLTLDEKGIPPTAEGRLEIASRILHAAMRLGIRREDVLIDCLTLTVSAEPKGALETLRAIRLVRERLGLNTVLGVSNISFGLPRRPLVSSAFFAMAMEAGLSAAIVNPKEEAMMDSFRSSMVLLGRDANAAAYVTAYAAAPPSPVPAAAADAPADVCERLRNAVVQGGKEGVVELVEEALRQGIPPLEVSSRGLLPGLEEVGRLFGAQRIFLPQVLLSSETMQAAFARLKEEMRGEGLRTEGTILMATVEGDIHDIGKNIVCTLLENHGFEVIDLGKNVPAARIISEALARNVDAVGLSALMTTTMTEMEKVVRQLREAGVPAFTMVGGAVVTEEYAREISADLYARDAMEAVAQIRAMLRKPA
ncbi:MAG TPA: homocysteine S-methyltransferase family protein [Verrucomicrobiae bacterium]|nr:homocysteine S-methyltransferase family protein [Verrucomicrobiae bacterium]